MFWLLGKPNRDNMLIGFDAYVEATVVQGLDMFWC